MKGFEGVNKHADNKQKISLESSTLNALMHFAVPKPPHNVAETSCAAAPRHASHVKDSIICLSITDVSK